MSTRIELAGRVAALLCGRGTVAKLGSDEGDWLHGAEVFSGAHEVRRFGVPKEAPGDSFDAVLLCPLLPHAGSAEITLREAGNLLLPGGILLALFDTVGARWCERGVAVVLSRADLNAQSIEACGSCLLAVATRRKQQPSLFRQLRNERRARAAELNDRGERLFGAGDTFGALKAFTEAVRTWDREAVYLNNLATALFANGEPERAWDHVFEALHVDPTLPSSRENLRALAVHLGRGDEAEHVLTLFGGEEIQH